MKIRDFKVEYQNGQMFLTEKSPVFSWRIESSGRDVMQESYRIIVREKDAAGETAATAGQDVSKIVWDSGVVTGDDSFYHRMTEQSLESQTEYSAYVKVTDNKGETDEAVLDFETTLFPENGFSGKWITYPGEEMDACPVFIKRFRAEKKIQKARVYASACGIYKAKINGGRVGKDLLTPGWTEYGERIQYQAYDVTPMLQEENTIEITVAKGWYSGEYNFFCTPHIYGNKTAAFMEVHLWYEDGEKSVIFTDESWSYTTGETRYAEIYHGQTIDYSCERMEEKAVMLLEKGTSMLTPQENIPVRIMEYRKPISHIVTPKGEQVLDFGQNMAGIIRARLKLKKGQKVTIRHGETLNENGNFYTTNLRQARATDVFIGNGEEQTYLPEFTYHGFRYICIEGLEEVRPDDFTACAIYSEMEELCDFTSSNPLLNQLYSNIKWGQKSNFVDIPTDCPQRDERLGWTGDAGVFSKTAAINMDTMLFFRKWLRDLQTGQGDTGAVPAVVPNLLGNTAEGAAVWGDCATLIPWNLYQIYGDSSILKDQYQSMRSWVEYLRRKSENDLISSGFQYGDWLALDKEMCLDGNTGGTNEMLIASIFYGVSVKIVADSAEVLGKTEDMQEYRELYKRIKKAVNREFVAPSGRIVSDTQTAYVLMLWFDIAEDKYKDTMAELLVQNLDRHRNKLTTGFAGTPFLCYALHKIGRTDLAGKILLTEDCPGWLYAVKKGATTIWERWDSVKPDGHMEDNGMNSLNHYAYGSVGSFLVEVIGGITAAAPGYRRVRIAPYPVRGITSARVEQKTPYGLVVSSWQWEDYHMKADITIPANVTAEVYLPGTDGKDNVIKIGSGEYHYEYDTELNLKAEKYNIDMKLEELFADEKACAAMEQVQPGLSEDKSLHTIANFTVRSLIEMTGEMGNLFGSVFRILNA